MLIQRYGTQWKKGKNAKRVIYQAKVDLCRIHKKAKCLEKGCRPFKKKITNFLFLHEGKKKSYAMSKLQRSRLSTVLDSNRFEPTKFGFKFEQTQIRIHKTLASNSNTQRHVESCIMSVNQILSDTQFRLYIYICVCIDHIWVRLTIYTKLVKSFK